MFLLLSKLYVRNQILSVGIYAIFEDKNLRKICFLGIKFKNFLYSILKIKNKKKSKGNYI